MIIHRTNEMSDEHNVVGANRFSEKPHLCVMRCSIPFRVITLHTSRDEVFPGIGSSLCFWYDMVNSERRINSPAILTLMAIAA